MATMKSRVIAVLPRSPAHAQHAVTAKQRRLKSSQPRSMRFNSRELALLAQQAASVDKEGVLYMKEKQDSIFKRTEVYIDRFFRLKGNLLFYFKNKEIRSEPLGVLVLERCTVELDLDEEALNSFVLVFEGEDNPFKFAAATEEERDGWIQALHMASYECLKMQLQSLREQFQARTGRDPVTLPDSLSSGLDLDVQSDSACVEPVLEISLSCSNLLCDSHGNMPNSLVLIHVIIPSQQQLWIHHNHTEIAEKNNNPMFLKTVGFGDGDGVDTSTRVRLTVYSVKERMTGTMAQLGQAVFTLQDVLMAPDMSLTLPLQSHDVRSAGRVTIMAWVNDSKVSLAQLQEGAAVLGPQEKPQPASHRKARTLSVGWTRDSLSLHFCNIIKRSFRFATNVESVSLQVHEYMAEFQHAFTIPIQLLRIWIDEEKLKNSLLQDLGELWPEWEAEQIAWITLAARTAEYYTNSLDALIEYRGASFKRSVDKDKSDLEFVPVNLHIQRMAVFTEADMSGKVYDTVTCGAATAFSKKYKNGGLRRMLQQQHSAYTCSTMSGSHTKLQHACALRNKATDLRHSISSQCAHILALARAESVQPLQTEMDHLAEQARELVRLCEDQILCEAAEGYMQTRRQSVSDGQEEVASLRVVHQQSTEKTHRWSGSDLVKSPTMEPWEVTKLNLEAAVVCLLSLVDSPSRQGYMADPLVWIRELEDGIAKLQHFIDVVSAKENKNSIQKMYEVKYRRDIVNSQMITIMVAAVCALVDSPQFMENSLLQRLSHCGILIQVEGLLSCYGDELAMLEDISVAVEDLSFVMVQFVSADKTDEHCPVFIVGRHTLTVQIPLQSEVFAQLPRKLQDGKLVKVCPVLFNIGINEEATYAEKFGSTVLQDRINTESLSRLQVYCDEVVRLSQDVGSTSSVGHLMKMLHANLSTKKSKNVEMLHLAAEVCHKLGGLRLTACKSGKDRTSMSVTLEMIQILQQHHNLAPHVFWQALDCVRSVGCRRENAYKNTGVRKYAFNRFQMLYIPKLYRAPGGTYGNIVT